MLIFKNTTLSILSICVAIQITVVLGRILTAFSVASSLYDALLYGAFIISSLLSFMIYKACQEKKHAIFSDYLYLIVESALTFLIISATFKSTIYDNSPALANGAVWGLLILTCIIKLFWVETLRFYHFIAVQIKRVQPWRMTLGAILIVAFIYMPRLEAVLAEIFIGEQAHHFDFFLMAPGLACTFGGMPYVDVISQYGVGIPVVLSKLSRLFGGFDYLPVLRMYMIFGICYFLIFYYFTRAWLGSFLLALAAFLVVFRLQMFHYGVSPLSWIYPSATPIRFGLDILWIWLLWRHLQTRQSIFLLLAAAYAGFAVYFMTATGLCILVTFYFYLGGLFLIERRRKEPVLHVKIIWTSMTLPLFSGFVLFWLTLGGHVFNEVFWKNGLEYIAYFTSGRGALPLHESLKYRHFWVAFMALVIPLTYIATAIAVSLLIWFKKWDRLFFLVVVIAVYGLVNYQYFVVRSALTSYYQNAVPFVLICAFWVNIGLRQVKPTHAKIIRWLCVIVALYALVTNHNYISYPNIFNFSRNPMVDITVAQRFPDRQGYFNHLVKHIKEEDKVALNAAGDQDEQLKTEDSFKTDQELIDFVNQAYDFTIDANLIKSLTKPKERVAIVSSFETKILINAKRPPFFYHTPLISSQPMRTRYFPADAAHSPTFVSDTLRQLEEGKPTLVFLENVFLQDRYPSSYNESHSNIISIIQYVKENYVPYKRGQYLTAMKIK